MGTNVNIGSLRGAKVTVLSVSNKTAKVSIKWAVVGSTTTAWVSATGRTNALALDAAIKSALRLLPASRRLYFTDMPAKRGPFATSLQLVVVGNALEGLCSPTSISTGKIKHFPVRFN